MLAFANHLCLPLKEGGRGFLASRLGFGNGSLVPIQERQSGGESYCEKVILFLVRVTWADLKVGILFGNFELQVGFGCCVERERVADVQAIENGISLNLPSGERFCIWWRFQVRPSEIKPFVARHRNADSGGQRRFGVGDLTFGSPDSQMRFGKLDAREIYFRSGYLPNREPGRQNLYLFRANLFIGVKQVQASSREKVI